MRILPSGTTALLLEVDELDEVLGLFAALTADPPPGVVDVVPAARTLLVVTDPAVTTLTEVAERVRRTEPRPGALRAGDLVEIPVTYDGEDLEDIARLLGCDVTEVVRRHTDVEWTVAFCGFVPGFGYLTSKDWPDQVPRRSSPRTSVPAGSVGLAGEFSGVYPRASPGGWQLLGRTDLEMFDPTRDPAAVLRPGALIRFVEA
ncbi:5-oxoprolinase subunit PxpB [Nocardioides terrisoli]|uniref:5-oxoprolinase subunit PxpB n=1 Tax=Nocardioides terrisoli TaxID=3388267 RepID=UPI00287BBA9E|nr:5-oxoprolinase subunit PxpB [Nocardioides marmorisolisilvae]